MIWRYGLCVEDLLVQVAEDSGVTLPPYTDPIQFAGVHAHLGFFYSPIGPIGTTDSW